MFNHCLTQRHGEIKYVTQALSSVSSEKLTQTLDELQSRVPVNARSCKHIRSLLGDAYENARIKLKNPDGAVPAAAEPKKTKAKPKKKNADDEGEEEEEDEEMEDASAKTQVPKLLLANKWDLEKGIDPTGWHASEKLDGVR
jgi:DNA ligase-1